MCIESVERTFDSRYIEKVMYGVSLSNGQPIRPAEIRWHMVFVKYQGNTQMILVGPWTTSGMVSYGADAEILWVQLRLGAFMPHLPTKDFLDRETALPNSVCDTFWLHSSAWQFPTYENVDVFIDRLVRADVLTVDPMVAAALADEPLNLAPRTVRHRFLRATGTTQYHIRQVERARHAVALLQSGLSILDTVYEAGYFDQPHLTRSLKRYIGYTPTHIAQYPVSASA